MPADYHKLVRDRIPDIIRADGHDCVTITLSEPEYLQALTNKLLEEAQEAASAPPTELIDELADLYEVLEALALATHLDPAEVAERRALKRQERGSFLKRICLLWVG